VRGSAGPAGADPSEFESAIEPRGFFATPSYLRLWFAGGIGNTMRWLELLVAGIYRPRPGWSPLGDRVDRGGVVWIDRLDQPETCGVRRKDLESVAGVVAIHAKGRDQDRAVDADFVMAATIWSPVTSSGPVRVPTQGRPGWLRS
jgi:hypothetical protein